MFSLQLISHLLGRFKLISDYYWALSPEKRYRFRLAAYAFAILAIGFIGGRITTVHRLVKVEQPDKEVAVDKSGAMSLTMPGVVLNADIYRFEKSTLQAVTEARAKANTNLSKFLVNVESRIYAQLSKQLADNMFAEGGATNGNFDFQGTNISWVKTGTDVTLTITEANGNRTDITVPIASFSF